MLDHMISLLYSNSGGVDFVLCIGDDSADEYMFQALQSRFGGSAQPHAPAVFTTVVGRKPSAAHYFLNDADEVLELCQSLRLHSTRANRNRSMGDLQRLHLERHWASGGSRTSSMRSSSISAADGASMSAMGACASMGSCGGHLDWSRAKQPGAAAVLGRQAPRESRSHDGA